MVKRANPQPLAQLLAWAAAELGAASPTPRLDAELLMAEALGGWSRARVLAEAQHTPTPQQQVAFERMVARRAQLEPVAYIIGRREFYGLDFEVTPDTLVPRPETELLVELALAAARRMVRDGARQVDVADIGTGTGCISVAVAANCTAARVLAVDLSAAALAVAARNVARHRVGAQVRLAQGDLLGPLSQPVDLLLSNPPYTILADIDENVRRHEPHLALDGGPDGLDLYRRLLADAPARLAPGGVATAAPWVSPISRMATPPGARRWPRWRGRPSPARRWRSTATWPGLIGWCWWTRADGEQGLWVLVQQNVLPPRHQGDKRERISRRHEDSTKKVIQTFAPSWYKESSVDRERSGLGGKIAYCTRSYHPL